MRFMYHLYLVLAVGALALIAAIVATPVFAGDWSTSITDKPKAAAPSGLGPNPGAKPAATRTAANPPPQTMLPQTLYLVRSTLLALHDANRTGNYTVLRDLSAPGVRDRTSSADVAQVFAALRKGNLDLSVAALVAPELNGPPMLDAAKRLHLNGEYPTTPSRIVFELVFEQVNGHWLLSDLAISTRPAAKATVN